MMLVTSVLPDAFICSMKPCVPERAIVPRLSANSSLFLHHDSEKGTSSRNHTTSTGARALNARVCVCALQMHK